MYPTGSPVDEIDPFRQYENILLPCLYDSSDSFKFIRFVFSTTVKTSSYSDPRQIVNIDSL